MQKLWLTVIGTDLDEGGTVWVGMGVGCVFMAVAGHGQASSSPSMVEAS